MTRFWLILAALSLSVAVTTAAAGEAERTERQIEKLQQAAELERQIEKLRKERDALDEQAGVLLDRAEAKDEEILSLQRKVKELKAPDKKLDFGSPVATGPLDVNLSGETFGQRSGEYWDVVLSRQDDIERCFTRAGDSGQFVVKLHVDAKGHVRSAMKESGTTLRSGTDICIRGLFQELRFPAHDENSMVSQPIAYEE